jgi:hypothetical protein
MDIVKYLLEGAALATVVFLTTGGKLTVATFAGLTLTVAVSLALLDSFSPRVATGVRRGAGFSVGMQQVGGCNSDTCGARIGITSTETEDSTETETEDSTELGSEDSIDLRPEILREMNLFPVPNKVGSCDIPKQTAGAQCNLTAGYNESVVAANEPLEQLAPI